MGVVLPALLILAALLMLVLAGRAEAFTMLQQFDQTIHAPASAVLLAERAKRGGV